MIRPLVWQVVWIDETGRGHGTCGHRHADAEDATRCPWEPTTPPAIGAGLVRPVRDPTYTAPEDGVALRRRPRQLELALGSG